MPDPLTDRVPVCTSCRLGLAPLPTPRCPRCDLPRGTGAGRPEECAPCADWPGVLRAARSVTALRSPADRLVRALKYHGWAGVAPLLGRRMAGLRPPEAAEGPPTLVVPVPTLAARVRRRGYNQALLLAREVARGMRLPLGDVLRRRGRGGSQVSLQAEERAANVETSFDAAPGGFDARRHRHVLVVDDVLTTGATAAAVSRVLGARGVRAVTVFTFARALPRPVDAAPK